MTIHPKNSFMPTPKPSALSKKSNLGLILLLSIIIIAGIVWKLIPISFLKEEALPDKSLDSTWVAYKSNNAKPAERTKDYNKASDYTRNNYLSKEAATFPLKLQAFDPNTASEEVLLGLGLQPKTVKIFLNYRNKGGRIRKKEDLKRIYTLSEADYDRIQPYIQIKTEQQQNYSNTYTANPNKPNYDNQYPTKQNSIVELNTCTADDLMRLKGIGPGYSRRILEQRDKLGGFIAVEQLKEVYGFPDSTYQQLLPYFQVNPNALKKISINTVEESQLAAHPYIGKKLAANIIKLRNDIKSFKQIEDLRQAPLINEEKYRKIAPYLDID
jgi:competence protein ComEA